MKAIHKKVESINPEIIEIEDSLNSLQKCIDGHIEMLCLSENVILLLDEEGKIKNKQSNFALQIPKRNFLDVIVGDVLILGVNGPEFRSLTDKECEKYLKIFSKKYIIL